MGVRTKSQIGRASEEAHLEGHSAEVERNEAERTTMASEEVARPRESRRRGSGGGGRCASDISESKLKHPEQCLDGNQNE